MRTHFAYPNQAIPRGSSLVGTIRVVLLALALLLALGCSPKTAESPALSRSMKALAPPAPMAEAAPAFEAAGFGGGTADAAAPGKPESPAPGAVGLERKLVKSAELSLRVADLDRAETAALELVKKLGGYVASTRKTEGYLSMSLRVPAAALDSALSGLLPLGTVLERSENTEDVTLRFYDLQGRLETKRQLLETLRAYLKRAQTIEEIMTVETRLADLQNEIDWLGTELRGLSDLIDFSRIELSLQPPPSALPERGPSLGDRIGAIFRSLGGYLAALAAGLVAAIVYGVPALLLVALLFWLLLGKVGLLRKLWRLLAKPRRRREESTETRQPM